MLRTRRERPRDCHATDKGDELAPPHGLLPEDDTLVHRCMRGCALQQN
jgi:hypothetical protein